MCGNYVKFIFISLWNCIRLNSLKHHNQLNFYLKLNGKLKFRLNKTKDIGGEEEHKQRLRIEFDSDYILRVFRFFIKM